MAKELIDYTQSTVGVELARLVDSSRSSEASRFVYSSAVSAHILSATRN